MPVDHYENFPVASILLPGKLRRPIEVIYAFARSADDFADEGDIEASERIRLLDEYDHQLMRIERGERPTLPLFVSLAAVIKQHDLPFVLFHDLLDAFKQDVVKTRYANFAELMDYCVRSANPIGRLLLHLNGAATTQNLAWSDAICSALQLINHWQDIGVDWRKNNGGRVYLPQDELAQFDISDADIAAKNSSEDWTEMMRFQCARARTLLHSGKPLTHQLSGRMGAELRLIVAGGTCMLGKIDAVHGDVFRHRPKMTKWDWFKIAPSALLSI